MFGRRLTNIFLLNSRQGLVAMWTRVVGIKKNRDKQLNVKTRIKSFLELKIDLAY